MKILFLLGFLFCAIGIFLNIVRMCKITNSLNGMREASKLDIYMLYWPFYGDRKLSKIDEKVALATRRLTNCSVITFVIGMMGIIAGFFYWVIALNR